jgi:hypothetical protein
MSENLNSSIQRTNNKIFSTFSEIGKKFLQLSLISKILILTLLLIIKTDINILSANIRGAYLPAANSLPIPLGYFSESLGNLILVRIFQISDERSWILLHILILIGFLLVVILILNSNKIFDNGLFLLIIFTTPALSAVLQTIGSYDSVTFFGSLLFVLLKSKIGTVLAAFTMVLGNPEQALIAFLCVFVLTFIPNFKDWRLRSVIAIFTSTLFWFIIQIWMWINNVKATRFTLIPHFIDLAVAKFWSDPAGSVWSYFGIFWLIALYIFFIFSGRNRKLLFTSLIFVPLVATLLTADGSRVFALISFSTLFIVLYWFWLNIIPYKFQSHAIGIYLCLWFVLPAGLSSNRIIDDYFSGVFSNIAALFGNLVVNIGKNFIS